jgi:hypothetical protein
LTPGTKILRPPAICRPISSRHQAQQTQTLDCASPFPCPPNHPAIVITLCCGMEAVDRRPSLGHRTAPRAPGSVAPMSLTADSAPLLPIHPSIITLHGGTLVEYSPIPHASMETASFRVAHWCLGARLPRLLITRSTSKPLSPAARQSLGSDGGDASLGLTLVARHPSRISSQLHEPNSAV